MHTSNYHTMDHYVKTVISILLGWFASYNYIVQMPPDPGAWEAAFRSLMTGAASYVGLSVVKYIGKYFFKKWRHYKSKKQS